METGISWQENKNVKKWEGSHRWQKPCFNMKSVKTTPCKFTMEIAPITRGPALAVACGPTAYHLLLVPGLA